MPDRTWLLLAAMLLAGGRLAAQDAADVQQANQQRLLLRQQIESLSSQMAQTEGQRSQLEEQVLVAETQAGVVARKLHELDQLLEEQVAGLQVLNHQRAALESGLTGERKALAAQMRSAYFIGRQDRLRLLLNQQDPSSLSRSLAYHDYLARARAERVRAIRDQIALIEQNQRQIVLQEQSIQQTREIELAQKRELERAQYLREQAMAALSAQLAQTGQALKSLQEDDLRLGRLLERLQGLLTEIQIPAHQQLSFSERRGKLNWPAKGRIRAVFGSEKGFGLTWDGMIIGAAEGSKVDAVHGGRVAYADWLRGFGLMIILDHGQGYMTLYGYNQSLYKEVGDWVEAGETIALVGAQEARGLYFSIRQQGTAQDPARWLVRKGNR